MRRVFLIAVSSLALGACFAPSAGAEALYRGRGPGIRVEFRVADGQIWFARVRTRLKCITHDRHQRRRYGESLGPTPIHGLRFHNEFETSEPGYSAEWLLEGAVHPGEITGRFWFQRAYDRGPVCQTKNFQTIGIRHVGRDSLRFWATRRPVRSRVRR
jgi:hypothetical protein